MLFMPPRHGKSTLASVAFPLGILAAILATNLLVARIRVRLLWASVERYDSSSASLLTKLRFKLDSILTASLQKLGLLQMAAVTLQLVSEVVLRVRGRTFFLSTIPSRTERDAESQNNRDSSWDWYTSTAYTRLLRVVEFLLFSLAGMMTT